MTTLAISEPDQHGRVTVTTDKYQILIAPESSRMPTALFISDALSHAADPELDRLAGEEEALGEKRWLERGEDAAVDDLYDRFNARIIASKTAIACEVLPLLSGVVTGSLDRAVSGAFFSKHAGCDVCPCSPGVVAGAGLRLNDEQVWIWIDPAN